MNEPDEMLEYWFGDAESAPDARADLWWGQVDDQEAVDDEIESRFGESTEHALEGGFDDWRDAPESCLALVLLLDQCPRHIYRGTARAFEGDERAVEIVQEAIDEGYDRELTVPQCIFLYMPLMHAEDASIQSQAIDRFRQLAERAPAEMKDMADDSIDHAREHAEMIEQFGRFPHRNPIFDRESTPEEKAYLEGTGRDYGQPPA